MRDGLVASGNTILAVSSEAVDDPDILSPKDSLSRARRHGAMMAHASDGGSRTRMVRSISHLQAVHTLLNLARLPARVLFLRRAIRSFRPDVIHALRLPYEGLTALVTSRRVPVVVSTWGLDFEPMASGDPLLRLWLRATLGRARGLHVDNPADHQRAINYGLPETVPHIYAAGNFGLDSALFHGGDEREQGLVVYPRRAIPGINYRGFVRAILELDSSLQFRAVGVGLIEVRDELLAEFGEQAMARIELTERLTSAEFASLMRKSDVVVSPATWDGTPNTIIEAYSCGCRLVVGRLEQFEALVDAGVDMHLVDPTSWEEMHQAIRELLLQRTESSGTRVVPAEFDRVANRSRFSDFYKKVLG